MTSAATDEAPQELAALFDVRQNELATNLAQHVGSLELLHSYCLRTDLRSIRLGGARDEVDLRLVDQGITRRSRLTVSRMSYGSPWEIVFTTALNGTPYAAVAGIGYGTLRAFRELLQMKMSWDEHRVRVAKSEQELEFLREEHAWNIVRDFDAQYPLSKRRGSISPAQEEIANAVKGLPDVLQIQELQDRSPDVRR